MKFCLSILFVLCAIASGSVAQTSSPNDRARYLAGLPVRNSAFDPLTRGGSYPEHVAYLNKSWAKKEGLALNPVRSWAAGAGGDFHNRSGTLYYMFSGPDFLYAHSLFPNASTYILCGTEPVGNVPELTQIPRETLDASMADLRRALNTMLNFNYFVTKEMRVYLQGGQLGGTMPVLYVFLARLGCTIQEVSLVSTPSTGVRIVFTGPNGGSKTLYYFKTDLSNGSSSGFLRWCASKGPGMSLLKADSYLLHNDGFSQVRRFILDNSRVIVQDDAGIPLRQFDDRWTLRFYGDYAAPIELFKQYQQPDLAAAYQRSPRQPLSFAFGYHWQRERAVLMVATRK
ncbi:MAG: hypothetical protein JWL90_3043 [Chthoniobacteraceae bacterium]|nr:hypothetical protein [Chthoniobacteraceae bacterium]MDB6175806.1 hypothetical protein [Chthoniobacteraceae bacterium]